MKAAPIEPAAPRDLELFGACPLCEGVLSLRVGSEGARSVCRGCGWWSRPVVHQGQDGLHLHHRTIGLA